MSTATARTLLTARTVPIVTPGGLLDLLPEHGALSWVRDGEGVVGWGVAARVELTGPDPFGAAAAWWRQQLAGMSVIDDVEAFGCGPLAFGSFAFDPGYDDGSSVLIVPAVVVGHRAGTWWLTSISAEDVVPELPARTPPRSPGTVRFADGSRTGTAWTSVVAEAVARIAGGALDKVVLARDLEARTEGPLDLRWPLRKLAASYPGCWTFAVDGLIGATPELLVRLERGVASSRVLAGTLRRSADPATERATVAALAGSAKDLEEHAYGVRSVADALRAHCTAVDVPPVPFVLELPNVMHLATDVRGTVRDGSTSLGLLASLHPSAAVGGTPREAALAVIREIEGLDRGRYTGPVGWLDAAGDGEWGIALRCAEVDRVDPARLRLFAGCGIVAGSQPQEELAETVAKLVPMRDALQD